jgi:hypothetical protein
MSVNCSGIIKINRYIRYAGSAGLLFLILLLAAGCKTNNENTNSITYSYHNPQKDFKAIGRVAFIEIYNDSTYIQISSDITEELFQAIQKKQVFGLTQVGQNDPAWRNLKIEPESELSPEQIQEIRTKLKCDALMIGKITSFSPHPHTSLGLRIKLLDLNDAQLVWAIDQVWDSTDKKTEQRIKNYFKQQISGSASTQEQLVSISPLQFFKFVSYEVAETLEKK